MTQMSLPDATAKAIGEIGNKPTLIVSVGAVYEISADKMAQTLRAQGAKVTHLHFNFMNDVAVQIGQSPLLPDTFECLVVIGASYHLEEILRMVRPHHRGNERRLFNIK